MIVLIPIYQFIQPFLDNKMSIFEKYGAFKKGKRKVQGVPQSQVAALPRHQEEE